MMMLAGWMLKNIIIAIIKICFYDVMTRTDNLILRVGLVTDNAECF